MPNLRQRGLTMRGRLAPAAAGITLNASRALDQGGTHRCVIEGVVVGRTRFAVNSTAGPRIEFGERDYLIPASSYNLGPDSTTVEPEEGDRFVETINGVALAFDVKPISGEPAWRYMDSGRTLLRVHVKRITDWMGE